MKADIQFSGTLLDVEAKAEATVKSRNARIEPIIREVPDLPKTGDEALDSIAYTEDGPLVISVWSPSNRQWELTLEFPQTYGFRVLDEMDLQEFQGLRNNSWLFEVQGGGWKALEMGRPQFQQFGNVEWIKEYLVVTRNECISIMTKDSFVLTLRDPDGTK